MSLISAALSLPYRLVGSLLRFPAQVQAYHQQRIARYGRVRVWFGTAPLD